MSELCVEGGDADHLCPVDLRPFIHPLQGIGGQIAKLRLQGLEQGNDHPPTTAYPINDRIHTGDHRLLCLESVLFTICTSHITSLLHNKYSLLFAPRSCHP